MRIHGIKNLSPQLFFNLKINAPVIKYAKRLITGALVIVVSFIFLYPQLFSCEVIRFSEFNEQSENIFISPEINPAQFNQIKKIIADSQMRIDSFFSGRKSSPVIIICSNPEQYEKYCSSTEGAGCSLASPWGSSFIILNLQGINVDVASHEMSHIELMKRLGWWKTANDVPQWFNEGVALMLDKRFVSNADPIGRYYDYMDEWLYYTRGGQEVLELKDISSVKGFFNGSQQYVMLAYMSSGLEISYWLAHTRNHNIKRFIVQMNTGKSFAESYKHAELPGKPNPRNKLPLNPLRIPDLGK